MLIAPLFIIFIIAQYWLERDFQNHVQRTLGPKIKATEDALAFMRKMEAEHNNRHNFH